MKMDALGTTFFNINTFLFLYKLAQIYFCSSHYFSFPTDIKHITVCPIPAISYKLSASRI